VTPDALRISSAIGWISSAGRAWAKACFTDGSRATLSATPTICCSYDARICRAWISVAATPTAATVVRTITTCSRSSWTRREVRRRMASIVPDVTIVAARDRNDQYDQYLHMVPRLRQRLLWSDGIG